MALPARLVRQLRRVVGRGSVETGPAELLVYQSDGLTIHSAQPECVVYPTNTGECARIIKLCHQAEVPFVARGAGTGLSGGAIIDGGVIIQLSRMNRVLALHPADRYAVVQPGVVNNYLSLQARPHGLEFAPDPSSQAVCTIGGNLAENAGGPHTLKVGVTANHILGQTAVLPDGEIVQLGGPYPVAPGPDFSAFLVGSEGTIAITTEIIVRLMPLAPSTSTMLATYDSVGAATDSVSAILGAGVLPAALELIDKLCIQAVEANLKVGFPTDAMAILLIELDGDQDEIAGQTETIERVCRRQGAVDFRLAADEKERQQLWLGRKHAVGAMGKISPGYYTNDGVVPRSRLTDILELVYRSGEHHGLRVANVCHAGDGNIHPLILFDPDATGDLERALDCSREILWACLEMGGSLTGEHGIGIEKRELMESMYAASDLGHMQRLRKGFNQRNLLNPGKIFPLGATCGEVRRPSPIPAGTWI
ncbi:MAG: FAD-binding protein [Candidatus Marinimicrobia bacterium]|nr:FAD-binding protein [Candidatus Neomarinimicrobiota bacterium]